MEGMMELTEFNKTTIKKILVFRMEREEYGIDISSISTIIEKTMDITRIPKTAQFVKGVINLRGEIVPVENLRLRLGFDEIQDTEDSRIIIVKGDEMSVGLIVDSVSEVLPIQEGQIESPAGISPELFMQEVREVAKVDGRVITVLDVDRIISLIPD